MAQRISLATDPCSGSQPSGSPTTTTKPDLVPRTTPTPNAPQNLVARHRVTHWRPHRHPTRRYEPPRAQRPWPTHIDAHRVVAFVRRELSASTVPLVDNASAYRMGRTQNPMPARVMKFTGNHPYSILPYGCGPHRSCSSTETCTRAPTRVAVPTRRPRSAMRTPRSPT
jgi:hypothetical protein